MSLFAVSIRPSGEQGHAQNADQARLAQSLARPAVNGWRALQVRHHGACTAVHQPLSLWREDRYDAQPITNARFCLTGRFFLHDRPTLAAALGLEPKDAKRLADAALVFRAWELWGPEAPKRLQGEFGFALWDDQEQTLYLVTDRWSNVGLYVYRGPQGIAASCSLRWLMALPSVPRRPNARYLAAALCDAAPFGDTPYEDIEAVPYATVLALAPSGRRSHRYWSLNPEHRIRYAKNDDYVEAARELLDRAVGQASRLDSPLVGTLTAGMDSAAVLGTLRRQMPGIPITAFTLSPPDHESAIDDTLMDESPHAARTAAAWPEVTHRVFKRSGNDRLLDDPRAHFGMTAGPTRSPLNGDFIEGIGAAARSLKARAIFTGGGGNMGLTYNGRFAVPTWLAAGRLDKALPALFALQAARGQGRRWTHLIADDILRLLLSPKAWQMVRAVLTGKKKPEWMHQTLINPDFADTIGLDDLRRGTLANGPGPAGQRDAGHWRGRWFEWVTHHSAAAGREVLIDRDGVMPLMPLRDTALLEFTLAIPEEQFIHRGTPRWLARRVLSDRVPAETLSRSLRTRQVGNTKLRLTGRRDFLVAEVERIARSSTVATMLDIPRMRALAADFPESEEDWIRDRVPDFIRLNTLTRALHAGQFVRWVEGGND